MPKTVCGRGPRETASISAMSTLEPQQLERTCATLDRWCAQDKICGAGLAVGGSDGTKFLRMFGRHGVAPDSKPMPPDAIFLVASITKPIVCTALLMLVERGELMLSDPVVRFVPEFAKAGKTDVQVRHLLTHTSGLPDMLPDNDQLRAAHEPLATFVSRTVDIGLAFRPGHRVQYQSMGIAMIGEIIRRVTGMDCREFLDAEILSPLAMGDSVLGTPAHWREGDRHCVSPKANRIAQIRITPDEAATDWHWNSDYWRSLGAPWGGLLTTPADLARFCRMMLNGGEMDGVRMLSPQTVDAMTSNQLACMPDVPEVERRCRPRGLGWWLNHRGTEESFTDLLSSNVYGHWGITGTLMWIDPEHDTFFVLLTTEPMAPDGQPYLIRMSNMVAAAIR